MNYYYEEAFLFIEKTDKKCTHDVYIYNGWNTLMTINYSHRQTILVRKKRIAYI